MFSAKIEAVHLERIEAAAAQDAKVMMK